MNSSDWRQWLMNDKTLLVFLFIFVFAAWIWTRDEKVFRLIDGFSGAIMGLVTGYRIGQVRNDHSGK